MSQCASSHSCEGLFQHYQHDGFHDPALVAVPVHIPMNASVFCFNIVKLAGETGEM